MFLSSSTRSACAEQYVQEAATHAEWARRSSPPCSSALGLLLYVQGVTNSGRQQYKRCKVTIVFHDYHRRLRTNVLGQTHLMLCLGVPYILGSGKRARPINTA